jgi:predicted porin
MNKKISAAVASAALVLGATTANAGIIIPAGEWTVDINGNVNVYASVANYDDSAAAAGGLSGAQDSTGEDKNQGIGTGLLPAWLGVTATTRQNDLDVSWTISMQPNVSENNVMGDSGDIVAWRQAFLTFGDASWGSVKMGKDLGIFAANAILNDMTLLGVGNGGGTSGGNFTNGHIGTGYLYPAWKGQVTYTTPNFNGFTAKVGITNPNQHVDPSVQAAYQDRFGIEGQLEYTFAAGKAWTSFASYDHSDTNQEAEAFVMDVGAALNFGNAGIVAYYYSGEGVGATFLGGNDAFGGASSGVASNGNERDSDGGYVQATYVIPSGTKLGVSYGRSTIDADASDTTVTVQDYNELWTVGAYHPLTKHLNLVAEYNMTESKDHGNTTSESDVISLGAILFF